MLSHAVGLQIVHPVSPHTGCSGTLIGIHGALVPLSRQLGSARKILASIGLAVLSDYISSKPQVRDRTARPEPASVTGTP
jgi:hypothetical protein